uniref:Uncharacterized protein n=1 Tax=Romanomermis culicivorax TaxID=13658 RepID=A0A915J766_ROMCU
MNCVTVLCAVFMVHIFQAVRGRPAPDGGLDALINSIVQAQQTKFLAPIASNVPGVPGGSSGGAPAVPGVPSPGGSGGSALNAGPASGALGGSGSPQGGGGGSGLDVGKAFSGSQGGSGGRTSDGGGQGGGGSNLNAGPVQAGSNTDVKSDKNGNTNVSQKKGIKGVYEEENNTSAGKSGFQSSSKKCIAGTICSESKIGGK